MKMNQKEATFNAICEVTDFKGEGKVVISKEQRAMVNLILFEGFRAGTIQIDKEFDDKDLKSYVSGLQSNWIRKDKRLNGNVVYVAQNPGSRQGSGDAQLKSLKALLTTVTTEADKQEIQAYIDARTAELSVAKAPTINFDALPEALSKFKK